MVCYNPGVKVTLTRIYAYYSFFILNFAYYSSIILNYFGTYYSQNYASIIYQGLTITIAASIALVALLLPLNMTVTIIGNLNGLIFYVKIIIVYAIKSILLPFQKTNFITVFIPWPNLELGIDTCYFPGMDTYVKTWLQLAFPT